jgi:hypothetical protein
MSRDTDPKALADTLRRLIPFWPKEIEERRPGQYPAIDIGAPMSERLARIVMNPTKGVGAEQWESLAEAALPAAQAVLGADIVAFGRWAVESALASGARAIRGPAALEAISLFGPNVGREVALKAWQSGYAGCLGRLILECERSGRPLPTPGTDLEYVQAWATALYERPSYPWVNAGTEPPLLGTLVVEVLFWWVDEYFRRLYPIFGDEHEIAARQELRRIAIGGYAIGRSHLEQSVLESMASEPTRPASP